jgi:hypothetical protein
LGWRAATAKHSPMPAVGLGRSSLAAVALQGFRIVKDMRSRERQHPSRRMYALSKIRGSRGSGGRPRGELPPLAKSGGQRVETALPDSGLPGCLDGQLQDGQLSYWHCLAILLGNGVTVAQQTLTLFVLVRIQVPQPENYM